jgi:uncharacterized RDD family membrane protein YckC
MDLIGTSFVAFLIANETLKISGQGRLDAALGIIIAVNVIYHGAMELIWGRSLGKMTCRLTVVQLDGRPPTMEQTLIRTLSRVVDILPNLYIVGYVLIRMNPQRSQRLGDRWAGTTVRPVTADSFAPRVAAAAGVTAGGCSRTGRGRSSHR